MGLAIPLIYEIFVAIDAIIYAIAGYAMQTFFAIARFEVPTEALNSFTYITNRVMLLCGIYALFRLAITMINYIVDPSKIDTLGKDGTKVAKNIIIAAVLLASSSMIFTSLFKFQSSVINTNVIPKIIYGDKNYSKDEEGDMGLTSKKFVNSVFMTLFLKGNDASELGENASNAVSRVLQGDSINIVAPYAYSSGFQYIPIITGLVGILLCYYFIKFSIELGIRLIKLFILQVISPIPIIMSVDPSQKGDKIKNFIKLYGGIYLSSFVRILTIYLAFATLSLLDEALSGYSFFIKILLIIAIFHASGEIPKLIEEALGTKLGLGDTGKGFGSIIKGTLAGGAGLVGGAIAGGISGGAGGALAGAFTGLTSGVTKGAAAKNAVGVLSAGTGAVKGGFGTGLKVAGAGGLVNYGFGKVDNFIGRNAGIDRKVADAEAKKNAFADFETAVYADYAKQEKDYYDPITGDKMGTVKIGTIDDDADVIAAREALRTYRENTDPNTLEGGQAEYEKRITTFRADIKKAEDDYKKKAFDWFESSSFEKSPDTSIANIKYEIKYNPKEYSSMTNSQKAHYELTKANDNKVLTRSETKTLKEEFDAQEKATKNNYTKLKDQQKTERYQHAKNVK